MDEDTCMVDVARFTAFSKPSRAAGVACRSARQMHAIRRNVTAGNGGKAHLCWKLGAAMADGRSAAQRRRESVLSTIRYFREYEAHVTKKISGRVLQDADSEGPRDNNLAVDGKETGSGRHPLLDAITEAGIHVPTLCFHPELERWGGCRLCTVELSRNGRSWVTASCTAPVEEGLTVRTDTPRVIASRRMMAELLLARTPNVPAIQRVAASLGVDSPPRFATSTPDETCIVCGRCVRACHEIAKKDVLASSNVAPTARHDGLRDMPLAVCD
jgi:ferredoxin